MKRIPLITALGLLLVAASATPAAAAPNLDFSADVRADRSVSLFVTEAPCRSRPCSYTWDIDGVRAGSSRSLVVTLEAGCHEVVLRMTERRFRNPDPLDLSTSRSVCVADAGVSAADAPATCDAGATGVDPAAGQPACETSTPAPAPAEATAAPAVTSTDTASTPDTTAAPSVTGTTTAAG